MEKITAKFNSKCAATGLPLKKGEEIFYDRQNKKAYHLSNNDAEAIYNQQQELKSISDYVAAQEEALYENQKF
jgi:hypothetical protein